MFYSTKFWRQPFVSNATDFANVNYYCIAMTINDDVGWFQIHVSDVV